MSYLASVTNYHSAMILKMTAGIDEHPFADGDIFTEIGIERWKYPGAIPVPRNRIARKVIHVLRPVCDMLYSAGK